MRVCTTYGSDVPLREGSDLHEIRLDVFDSIPEGVKGDVVLTLCGKDIGCVPEDFKGLVDVGYNDVKSSHRIIKSYHDFDRTPSPDEILRMLTMGDQEISKGAFVASSFNDLYSILDASRRIDRKHVLLGMGAIGEITRIRQKILGNEFSFGYHGVGTAPGQLSADEMERLGDDCKIVGITGHPLSHTKSPAMQNAAISELGINGKYLVFDSPNLDHIEDVIRGYDIRGMNVTIPYKIDVMDHLDSLSKASECVGAVNTIINDDGRLTGTNTDVTGISYALRDVELKGSKALILGSGGAARAAAYSLTDSGCDVSISGRNAITVKQLSDDFGLNIHVGDVKGFDVIVNCTPIGLVEGEYPADISVLTGEQVVFDMVYGRETGIITKAKEVGCMMADGQDMLIGQGAESFRLWFGKDPDVEVMRGAIQ